MQLRPVRLAAVRYSNQHPFSPSNQCDPQIRHLTFDGLFDGVVQNDPQTAAELDRVHIDALNRLDRLHNGIDMQLLGADQLRGQNALQFLDFDILQRTELIVIVLHSLADREDFAVKICIQPFHILGAYVFGHR
ncbi:hypothetical protein D3C73_951670 [compost metagenome]